LTTEPAIPPSSDVTILSINPQGLAEIAAALRHGEAVLIPFPSPLPYVLAATDASAVNQATGRPRNQPCGILSTAENVAPALDLDPEAIELGIWIAQVEQANLLVPLVPEAPQWLNSSAVNGFVGITLAWLAETRPLAEHFGHLFVSSGNLTTGPVGVTAPEVDSIFNGQSLVLDGDPYRNAIRPHASATIIEIRKPGVLRVARDGINNRSVAADNSTYLQVLSNRFDDHHRLQTAGQAKPTDTAEA
jgi:tRNA A37 threonylcarbamoyladenosine synthetase subunit TsaC/SUA5/YrdC